MGTVDREQVKVVVREYRSRTEAFTPDNLETARQVLVRAHKQDWLLDEPPNCPHRVPCFSVADLEWLLGYIDHLETKAREAMAECGTSSTTHHKLREIVPDWAEQGGDYPRTETDGPT